MYILGLPVVYEVGITLNTYYTTKGYYLNLLVNIEHDTGWTPAQSIPESYTANFASHLYIPARAEGILGTSYVGLHSASGRPRASV